MVERLRMRGSQHRDAALFYLFFSRSIFARVFAKYAITSGIPSEIFVKSTDIFSILLIIATYELLRLTFLHNVRTYFVTDPTDMIR